MPITQLTQTAPEQGLYQVQLALTVTPKTLYWGLRTLTGTVVNNRDAIEVPNPTATQKITLMGDDLRLTSNRQIDRKRRLTLSGTFDTETHTDLPFTAEYEFEIDHFVGVQ